MVRLQKAHVLCYRLFDVADSIDLDKAKALVAGFQRMLLKRVGSQFIQLSNPPLSVELGRRPLPLKSGATEVEVGARLFDHGALSVTLKVPVAPGTSLAQMVPLTDELFDAPQVDALCEQVARQLCSSLTPAFEDPHLWDKTEGYHALFAQEIEGNPTAQELLAAPELPKLILGESLETPLSEREAATVLEHHFSYTQQDLVVVDWSGAFIYEPSGSADIPDLLEVANAQLLELRYYDEVLETELNRLYEVVGAKNGSSLFFSPYKKQLRALTLTLIEVSEFVERVENSLKIIGDVYLARVYEAALAQLRVVAWQEDVTRKQKLLFQIYEVLKGEVDTARALTLEVMVVLLIVTEILLALGSVIPH